MPDLMLTAEQARLLITATERVTVRDPDGAALGVLNPMDAAALAQHRKRRAEPGPRMVYTSQSTEAMLDALQSERDRIGPFDVEYMREFIRRLEESDPEKYGPKVRT
jgi:hypothetical protein